MGWYPVFVSGGVHPYQIYNSRFGGGMRKIMMRMKRIIGIVLLLILVFGLFGGCAGQKAVMTVGGNKVSLEEYRYYYLNAKYNYDNGDDSFWEKYPEAKEELEDYTLDMIKQAYALRKVAADNGVTLSKDDKKSISEQLDELVTQMGGKEEYETALKESYLTDELYRSLLEIDVLMDTLANTVFAEGGQYYVTDEEVLRVVDEDYIRTTQILIAFNEEEDAEATKARAEEVLKKAKAGEDFDTLVAQYNEDPGMVDNTDGYYFTKGQMVTPYEEASFALQENELSGLVESSYGYHIIKRLPKEDAYIQANLEQFRTPLINAKWAELLQKAIDEMTVEYDKQFEQINMDSLKDA